jgi:hypothetical protein
MRPDLTDILDDAPSAILLYPRWRARSGLN